MTPSVTTDEGYFPALDGLRLHYHWYRPTASPRAGALLVHGYADHAGRYAEVGRALAATGIAALAFDYRGHGLADGQRGHCDRFTEYLGDLESAWALMRTQLGDLPLGLVAHSHGALIALRLLCDPQRSLDDLQGAVLSAPFLRLRMPVSQIKATLASLASRVAPRLTLPAGIKSTDVSRDPEIVAAREGDPLVHDLATARWFTESSAAQEYVVAHCDRLSLPCLWLVGTADPIADPAATLDAFERAGGEKEWQVYQGFLHEPLHELGRAQVLHDVVGWLSRRLFGEGRPRV